MAAGTLKEMCTGRVELFRYKALVPCCVTQGKPHPFTFLPIEFESLRSESQSRTTGPALVLGFELLLLHPAYGATHLLSQVQAQVRQWTREAFRVLAQVVVTPTRRPWARRQSASRACVCV